MIKYYLVGGNGEVVQTKILPNIDDAGIDRLYNKLILTDPNHAAFPGSKREYVKTMYVRLSSFLFTQSALLPKTLTGSGIDDDATDDDVTEDDVTDDDATDDERETLALDLTESLMELDSTMDIKDKKKLKENILHATTKNEATEVSKKLEEIFIEKLESISEVDIDRVIKVWTDYSKQLQDTILKEKPDSKMALELAEKTLLITLYPLATNFESINGIPTQQRRVFYGLMQHSQFMSEEQSKVGEYLIRSNEDLMKKYGFKNDIYNEATFVFEQRLLESDIMDLQQIENNKIVALGEIKTFDQDDLAVKIQYSKALLIIQSMKTGAYLLDTNKNKIMFSMKDTVPIFMNGVDTDLMKRSDVSSRNVIPITKVYDLTEAVNKLKLVTNNGTNLYDELASLNLTDYFKINKYGRIFTAGKAIPSEIFDKYTTTQRKKGMVTYSNRMIKFNNLTEINEIQREDPMTIVTDKAKPKTIYKPSITTEYHTSHRLPQEGEPGFKIYSTRNIQPAAEKNPTEFTTKQLGILNDMATGKITWDSWSTDISKKNSIGESTASLLANLIHPDFNMKLTIPKFKETTGLDYNKDQIKQAYLKWLQYASTQYKNKLPIQNVKDYLSNEIEL